MGPVYFSPVYFLDTQWIKRFKSVPNSLCVTAESGLPSNLDYLSLGERPLSAFKDQLCSLVFTALTDPNTQLQLVGIRTLSVLGAQPGTLKKKKRWGIGPFLVIFCLE